MAEDGETRMRIRAEKAEAVLADQHKSIDHRHEQIADLKAELAKANKKSFAYLTELIETQAERDNIADNLALLERHDQERIDRLEAELAAERSAMSIYIKNFKNMRAERDELREALEWYAAKAILCATKDALTVKGVLDDLRDDAGYRARDALAGGSDQEARCDCYPSPENWGVCRDCGKDILDSGTET